MEVLRDVALYHLDQYTLHYTAQHPALHMLLPNNFSNDFSLGNRFIIFYTFRNIFPKVFWVGPQICVNSF
jgi:hypothetical protein